MMTTSFTGAATRGLAALAALLVFAACDDAQTPPASSEAGSKVAPIDPGALGAAPSDPKGPGPAPAAKTGTADAPDSPGDPEPVAPEPVAPDPDPVAPDPGSDEAPARSSDPNAPFAVVDLGVGTGVAGRELQGRAARFDTSQGTLHAWVMLKNEGDPQDIDMIWRKQGVETFRYQLTIGKSPSWRTWSRKTITEADSGFWSVEVVTKSGDVLATQKFTID